ncbi:hypothetical protein SDRG_10822 [Saprolegnia diclina VS20]|uniref:SUN domain-containing protein n=1 Tax=Saprolegnia diclina (strain VS20) TaxID=1156394 RepID=T0RNN6_SAPDV|nr:hypothetical protein SDRG_10822 [Saprolegnia diclina VS20]EQC31657.1 hypothetical protein SDRG_10822 [Saprolegnia diclina VS20]|eukprot:XP_008615056.1 hypothetical protein SDRG_10822 [Saprolegnia diclina VS20]
MQHATSNPSDAQLDWTVLPTSHRNTSKGNNATADGLAEHGEAGPEDEAAGPEDEAVVSEEDKTASFWEQGLPTLAMLQEWFIILATACIIFYAWYLVLAFSSIIKHTPTAFPEPTAFDDNLRCCNGIYAQLGFMHESFGEKVATLAAKTTALGDTASALTEQYPHWEAKLQSFEKATSALQESVRANTLALFNLEAKLQTVKEAAAPTCKTPEHRFNYASPSLGGAIVTHASEFFKPTLLGVIADVLSPTRLTSSSHVDASFFGFEFMSTTPENTISFKIPGENPDGWHLAGTSGNLTIRFGSPILVDAVQLDHAHADASSAPKMLQLEGLTAHPERHYVEFTDFGTFEFRADGAVQQPFALDGVAATTPIHGIRVHVLSNHGREEYTVLSSIEVYGARV